MGGESNQHGRGVDSGKGEEVERAGDQTVRNRVLQISRGDWGGRVGDRRHVNGAVKTKGHRRSKCLKVFLRSRDRSQTVAGGLPAGRDEGQDAQRHTEERGGGRRAAGRGRPGGVLFPLHPVDLSMFL